MNEEMKQRMAHRPDEHTLAWWKTQLDGIAKAYRGATHATNLVVAEVQDHTDFVKSLQAQVKSLGEALHEAQAAIGRLQAEVTDLQTAMQKARELYAALKEKTK